MSEIRHYLDQQVLANSFPGYSYGIVARTGLLETFQGGSFADAQGLPHPIDPDTLFDIASLTKPVATAAVYKRLADHGQLDLSSDLAFLLGPQCPEDKREVTLCDLLSHRAGFSDWYPLYAACRLPEQVLPFLLAMPLQGQGRDQPRCQYSCLDYILLGELLPIICGQDLGTLAQELVFQPLGMSRTCFFPYNPKENCAATELGNDLEAKQIQARNMPKTSVRTRLIHGQVHDGNAYFLGRPAGNAGLFSTVQDLALFCQMLLNNGHSGSDLFFSKQCLDWTRTCYCEHGPDRFSIGWHLSAPGWSGGPTLSSESIGHTGFTGCSLYLDFTREIAIVLLTNRVHSQPDNRPIKKVRQKLNEMVIQKYGFRIEQSC
ncbi:beta-lactamase family protein [bacterium]|nr:beta-lactamase family protein [bacterium]